MQTGLQWDHLPALTVAHLQTLLDAAEHATLVGLGPRSLEAVHLLRAPAWQLLAPLTPAIFSSNTCI